jgi:pimeloyl-ACP methyl ester carboxylesterase
MIVDTFPFAGVMFDEKATAESVRPLAAMLKVRMESGYPGPQGAVAAAATADGLTAKAESAALVKSWMLQADPKVAAATMAEDLVLDMRARLPALTMPVTVVHPAEALGRDEQSTTAFYRGQYAGTPNIQFEAVRESGHFIMLDQPEAFGRLLDDFVK